MTMIRTAKINAFLREADRRGLNPEHLLSSCGVPLSHFKGHRRIETDFEHVRRALTALAFAIAISNGASCPAMASTSHFRSRSD